MRTLHLSIDGGRGLDPAEGRTDLGLPGADRASTPGPSGIPGNAPDVRGPDAGDPEAPPSPEAERRDELAERVGTGGPSPAGRDRPDVLPDVEPPEAQA